MTKKRRKQIQALAADDRTPDEIVELLDVSVADVTEALTAQIEEADAEPLAGEARVEVWRRHDKQGQSPEHIALAMGVGFAVVEATIAAVRKDRGDGRSRGPVAEAFAANERLKRILTGRSGKRTADGDSGSSRRPGETDYEQYMRERERGRGGRGVL